MSKFPLVLLVAAALIPSTLFAQSDVSPSGQDQFPRNEFRNSATPANDNAALINFDLSQTNAFRIAKEVSAEAAEGIGSETSSLVVEGQRANISSPDKEVTSFLNDVSFPLIVLGGIVLIVLTGAIVQKRKVATTRARYPDFYYEIPPR